MRDFAPPPAREAAPTPAPAAARLGPDGRRLARIGSALDAGAPVQRLADRAARLNVTAPVQSRPNRTGLPDGLKSGVEALSGVSLDGVRVHRGSDAPGRIGAHAFARGTDIHLAPGQDRHLPHEAWHVAQQAQGRVAATTQMAGVAINDDRGLEREADVMGARALAVGSGPAQRAEITPAPSAGKLVLQGFYHESYGALHNGSGTEAWVGIEGKNDPDLANGSAPSTTPHWWPTSGPEHDWLSKYAVQGHLLNDNLGGTGKDMKNLTPIARSTNTQHFHSVEDQVKKAVLVDDKPVEYRVRATYGTPPTLSDLGNGAPPQLAPYLPYFCDTLAADYTTYDPKTAKANGGLPGELLVKNEGPHLKGTF